MSVTIVDAVLDDILVNISSNSMPALRLYQGDVTPAAGDDVADYTEADFSGYATKTWGFASFDTDHAKHETGAIDFVHNGGATANDIYGFFAHESSEMLLAGRLPSTPVVMDSSPDTLHMEQVQFRLHRWGAGPAKDFLVADDRLKLETDALVGYPAGGSGNIQVRLFTNSITPAVDDVVGDYTEATFSGYAVKTLDSNEATVAGNVATSTSDLLTFTRSSDGTPETVYGYYVLIFVNGSYRFIGAQLFDTPKVMEFNGDYLAFKLRCRLRNLSG